MASSYPNDCRVDTNGVDMICNVRGMLSSVQGVHDTIDCPQLAGHVSCPTRTN